MLMALLVVLAIVFTLTEHEIYRIKDDRTPNDTPVDRKLKSLWHFYKGLFQVLNAVLIGIAFGKEYSFFFASLYTLYQDAFINIKVLGKPIDYEGETAWLDITLKKIFKKDIIIFILKLLILAASITWLIIKRA